MAAHRRDAPIDLLLPAAGAGLLLGILVGLVLGWQVWPVRWFDTDPADLRLEHQIDQVILAADSLATTGDAEAAARRLEALIDGDTSWEQVANLVMRVAVAQDESGNRASGDRIRALFDTLAMPSPLEEEFVPASAGPSRGMWIGAGALGLGALACLGWLAVALGVGRGSGAGAGKPQTSRPAGSRPGTAPRPSARPTPKQGAPAASGGHKPLFVPTAPLPAQPAPTQTAPAGAYAGASDDADDEWADDGLNLAVEDDYADVEDDYATAEPLVPQGEAYYDADAAADDAAYDDGGADYPGALGVYEAEYRHGDREFDCSFSIEDEEGNFLGECGVGVADVLEGPGGPGAAGASALEVWLFDKQDIRTVSTLLVTEYAYHDDALNVRLASKGDLELVQQGLTVTLETLTLQVTATVRAFGYAKGGPGPNSVFSHVAVELLAEEAEEA